MKNINPHTLGFIVLFYSLLNVAIHSILTRMGFIGWYERSKAKWMPCTGFCIFSIVSIVEIGYYLFSYPPIDYFNLVFIISLALCSAVISTFIVDNLKPKHEANRRI